MDANQKVLIATDVPFWRRSTGAEQRIASLAHFMSSAGHRVKVFFLATSPLEESDSVSIGKLTFEVDVHSSEQVPKQLMNRIRWWLEATRHQYASQTTQPNPLTDASANENENDGSSQTEAPKHRPAPTTLTTTLTDYDWPWARRAFAESVQAYQPDVILIEYVKLAYLLESLNRQQRSRICCAIDTHDVLHQRCESFRQQGCQHWIEISRDEETEQLNRFDVVIAIQADEAKSFREMTSGPKVVVCPHVVYADQSRFPTSNRQPPVVGFLASNNDANSIALENFICRIWRPTYDVASTESPTPKSSNEPRLLIGGSVCQSTWLEKYVDGDQGVYLLGHVDPLETFYDQIDLAINPVEFGSGLKIKSVEALGFGRPLLTTPHGATGLCDMIPAAAIQNGSVGPVMIYQTAAEFAELYQAFRDPTVRQSISKAVARVAETDLSEKALYSDLNQVLFAKR